MANCQTSNDSANIFYPDEEDEYDPVYEAQLEAHDACTNMLVTISKHLEALETGTLTEEQRHCIPDETDNLLKTVKLKMDKVSRPHKEWTKQEQGDEDDLETAKSEDEKEIASSQPAVNGHEPSQ